jgi:hypothetical protein
MPASVGPHAYLRRTVPDSVSRPPGTRAQKLNPPAHAPWTGGSSRLLLLNPYRVRAPVSGSITKLSFVLISEGRVAINPAIGIA